MFLLDSLADATKKAYKAQEKSHLSSGSDTETYQNEDRRNYHLDVRTVLLMMKI